MRDATSSFSGDDATAVTEAPRIAPSCTAARPTPPAAPSTISSSPGSHARDRPEHVVGGAVRDAEGGRVPVVDAVRDAARRSRPPTTTSSANAPKSPVPNTRSPTDRVGDAVGDLDDDTGELAAGDERRRHLDLVLVRDEQHVGEVDRGRVRPGPAPAPARATATGGPRPARPRARRTRGRRRRAPQLTDRARPAARFSTNASAPSCASSLPNTTGCNSRIRSHAPRGVRDAQPDELFHRRDRERAVGRDPLRERDGGVQHLVGRDHRVDQPELVRRARR